MSVTPKTTLRGAAMKAREVSKNVTITGLPRLQCKPVRVPKSWWIGWTRVLADTADYTKQFGSGLAALVAGARKRCIDSKTIAAKLHEVDNALGEEGKAASQPTTSAHCC